MDALQVRVNEEMGKFVRRPFTSQGRPIVVTGEVEPVVADVTQVAAGVETDTIAPGQKVTGVGSFVLTSEMQPFDASNV